MQRELWQKLLLSPGNEDHVWELFHENSKVNRHDGSLSVEEILTRLKEFHECLPFRGHPVIELPRGLMPLNRSLGEAISARVSVRELEPSLLTLKQVATLLRHAYGVSRNNKDTIYPRPFRVVPSGGALYPLEIFFHSAHIKGHKAGIYHYNPCQNNLRLLWEGDATSKISQAMVQPEIAPGASLIIFITAIFERSIFKYGDRGYRFVLLEAGHVAQNINLVSNTLGLGSVNIGGFFDREIDEFLGLDGVTHSTVYMIAVGKKKKESQPATLQG